MIKKLRHRALAYFLFAHGRFESQRQDVGLPGLGWERARLDKLAAEARAWLDASPEPG